MNLENMENSPRKAAENNRCGFHRVKLVSRKSAALGVSGRKTSPNKAKHLAGGWKTKRAGMRRQSHPALTIARKVVRHG